MKSYCLHCGKILPQTPVRRGRKRQYCSDACQQRAYRDRKELRNTRLRNTSLDVFFCAGDNREFFQVAHECGYLLGIRSGRQSYGFDIQFVDIEYRKANFEKHLAVVARYRPKYATVLDLSETEVSKDDIARALRQYEQLAEHAEIPLIVPKLPGQIAMLPRDVALGYSIPTSYGGAQYTIDELENRRIHLLGGSPHDQMDYFIRLSDFAHVISADGNMAMRIARDFSKFWQNGAWVAHPDKGKTSEHLYLDCWRRSCTNIRAMWSTLTNVTEPAKRQTRKRERAS